MDIDHDDRHHAKGIYRIINITNYNYYIGMTTSSFKKRCWEHRNELRKNKHGNRHLQYAFNKYGEDKFVFQIYSVYDLEIFDELEAFESLLIHEHGKFDTIYNIAPGGKSCKGIKRTKEFVDNMSKKIVQLDKNNSLLNTFNSVAEASRLTGINRGDIGAYARGKSRAVFVGNCKWVFLDNYNKGIIPENREYLIDIRNNCRIVRLFNGEIIKTYTSSNEARVIDGLNYNDIRACLLKKKKTCRLGYEWKWEDELTD